MKTLPHLQNKMLRTSMAYLKFDTLYVIIISFTLLTYYLAGHYSSCLAITKLLEAKCCCLCLEVRILFQFNLIWLTYLAGDYAFCTFGFSYTQFQFSLPNNRHTYHVARSILNTSAAVPHS